uniref:Uncharacterized protein n=1 Tax=Globisporangium ultimum (strain ATCC 200006 / CBS 805.95 / DAOM BR144) TaxID=431595 RepID=K3WPY5_GLOUD
MATNSSNPWALADNRATPYRVNVGGLRAFVQRNELETRDAIRADGYSSMELLQHLNVLLTSRSNVLNLTRELEQLERAISTSGCMLPHQLALRVDSARMLRDQVISVLTMRPVILRTLRKSVGAEGAIDVEMEHQQTFIDLFLKIGDELPRYTHVLSTLASMDRVMSDLSRRQSEFESVVAALTAVIAEYQSVHDEIKQVRSVYSQLQNDASAMSIQQS